jgi:hypothetical protein
MLHDTLGMKKFYLRSVLHALDTNQTAERVILSNGILLVLQRVRSTDFQSVITGDEFWFFLYYPRVGYERRDEVKCQKEPVKNLTQKRVVNRDRRARVLP